MQEYWEQKDQLHIYERILLMTLSFDVNVTHPYKVHDCIHRTNTRNHMHAHVPKLIFVSSEFIVPHQFVYVQLVMYKVKSIINSNMKNNPSRGHARQHKAHMKQMAADSWNFVNDRSIHF